MAVIHNFAASTYTAQLHSHATAVALMAQSSLIPVGDSSFVDIFVPGSAVPACMHRYPQALWCHILMLFPLLWVCCGCCDLIATICAFKWSDHTRLHGTLLLLGDTRQSLRWATGQYGVAWQVVAAACLCCQLYAGLHCSSFPAGSTMCDC